MPVATTPRPKFTTPTPMRGAPGPLREALGALLMVAGISAYLMHQDLTAAGAHFMAGAAVLGVSLPWSGPHMWGQRSPD